MYVYVYVALVCRLCAVVIGFLLILQDFICAVFVFFFVAQHADSTILIYSFSVCLSVHLVVVLCLSKCACHQTFSTIS